MFELENHLKNVI